MCRLRKCAIQEALAANPFGWSGRPSHRPPRLDPGITQGVAPNLKVAGSNPAPATINDEGLRTASARRMRFFSSSTDDGGRFSSSSLTREALEACVVPGRHELPPVGSMEYVAFVDASGGHRRAVPAPIRTGPLIGIHDPRRTTRLRVQFVSSPGGSTSRLELEIASESPTTWPKAA
jgi:hypothetical protein